MASRRVGGLSVVVSRICYWEQNQQQQYVEFGCINNTMYYSSYPIHISTSYQVILPTCPWNSTISLDEVRWCPQIGSAQTHQWFRPHRSLLVEGVCYPSTPMICHCQGFAYVLSFIRNRIEPRSFLLVDLNQRKGSVLGEGRVVALSSNRWDRRFLRMMIGIWSWKKWKLVDVSCRTSSAGCKPGRRHLSTAGKDVKRIFNEQQQVTCRKEEGRWTEYYALL